MRIKITLILLLILIIPICGIAEINIFNGEIYGNFEIGKDLQTDRAYTLLNLGYCFPFGELTNHVYGGWETWFNLPESGITMQHPLRQIYKIGCKFEYKSFYLILKHDCTHPVYTINPHYQSEMWDDYINTISIGIEW